MSLKTISVLSFLVAIAAMFGLIYPALLSGHGPGEFGHLSAHNHLFGTGPISIGLQIAGLLLIVWARITFKTRSFHLAANPTEGGLVTTGPYHYIRNPIYAGAMLAVWAGVAVHASLVTVALGMVFTAGMLGRVYCEERLVRAMYPDYEEYARKTRRLVPLVW
jgi:protein-S-isoprenylcysteine O-methyltransferase Ste14